MQFRPTPIPGVVRIDCEPHADSRGLFARLYCPSEFAAAGIPLADAWQVSLSRNPTCNTLRGLHVRSRPPGEAKLVRAVRGRAYDVVVDLRRESPACGQWLATELDAIAMNAVLIPPGCAHGFLTLQPNTDVLYQISPLYDGGESAGVRWDDPAFSIDWPAAPALLTERDARWPDWVSPATAAQAIAAQ